MKDDQLRRVEGKSRWTGGGARNGEGVDGKKAEGRKVGARCLVLKRFYALPTRVCKSEDGNARSYPRPQDGLAQPSKTLSKDGQSREHSQDVSQ